MDNFSALFGLFMGYFLPSISVFIVEYIFNKSTGSTWGYKVTKIVLALNVAFLVFLFWFNKNGGNGNAF